MALDPDRLPALLRAVAGDRPDRESVREVVQVARDLAAAFLRVRRVRFDGPWQAQSHQDLALDLVADLFRRDDDGRFPEIRGFFGEIPADGIECLGELRRLVCSRVTQGLFERNRRLDPELARLIRNIKLASRRLDFDVESRWGGRWIVFGDGRWERPLIAVEILEAHLVAFLREGTSLDDILRATEDVLARSDLYRTALPVVLAAQVIRTAWIRLQAGGDGSTEPLEPDGFQALVDHAVDVVRATLRASYLASGKLPTEIFESYLRVARSWVSAEMAVSGPRMSLFERMVQEHPDLDRHGFVREHRARLEYIARLVREQFIAEAREELSGSASTSR
jgi:hypothetical protein